MAVYNHLGSLSGGSSLGNVASSQYQRYMTNYRDYEDSLVGDVDDTSLVDAAREEAPKQAELAAGIAERNRQRYGYSQTAVERQEADRASQRGQALSLAGGLSNARLAQRDANRGLLGELINIGQGVNRSALSGLATSEQNAVNRRNAFERAKGARKQQNTQMMMQLGTMAMMAMI